MKFADEFERRVKRALLPDHADHDLIAVEIVYVGEDGYRYSSYTFADPSAEITAYGPCGCGEHVYGRQNLASDDFPAFMRTITND